MPKIEDGINPATWMLEVGHVSALHDKPALHCRSRLRQKLRQQLVIAGKVTSCLTPSAACTVLCQLFAPVQVSSRGAETRIGIDFAEVYKGSELSKCVLPMHAQCW